MQPAIIATWIQASASLRNPCARIVNDLPAVRMLVRQNNIGSEPQDACGCGVKNGEGGAWRNVLAPPVAAGPTCCAACGREHSA